MYNTTDMSLNGLADMDSFAKCRKESWDSFNCEAIDNPTDKELCRGSRMRAAESCNYLKGGTSKMTGNTLSVGAQNFLNNQALTVSAPKPLVSPARVNPTFSQIPAYSTQGVPFSAYGDNATYGTYSNPIRLGNTEPAVDNTPDIFKKENLTKTIGITAGILVVGYFAYKEFGGKKGTRRRR